MQQFIDRPEIQGYELWQNEFHTSTTILLDVDGLSPIITNHLSSMTYEVIGGDGLFTTANLTAAVESGDELKFKRAEPYQYIGKMTLLATARPGLLRGFTTFDNQRLGKAERQYLRRMYRTNRKQQVQTEVSETLTRWIGPRESHLALLASMQDN